MILATESGRALSVTSEVLWDLGRVVYVVDKVGTFTMERDEYGRTDDRARALHVHYGRHDGEDWYSGDEPLPDAPVVFGITITGGATYPEERFTDPAYRPSWYWPARRARSAGGGAVPTRTAGRVEAIVRVLTLDYITRPDYDAIEHARAQYLAPTRLRKHHSRITELREQVARFTVELDRELRLADVQAAITEPTRFTEPARQ